MSQSPQHDTENRDTTSSAQADMSQASTSPLTDHPGGGSHFTGISEIVGIRRIDETSDPLLGRAIDGVDLVRVIAEGGMGRVYEGRQRSPNRSVAVKMLRPGFMTPEVTKRFAREAKILGGLQHPNIAEVFWAGTVDVLGTTVPYIVMELVEGGLPLTTYAQKHSLSTTERIRIFRTVCDAVGRAHAEGIVHRDLKPGNVLVGATGEPKLIDFGIAKIADAFSEGTALTEVGRIIGTVQYMSPEQLAGDAARPDPRMDIYALGLLLHELVTGRRPYDIDSRRVFDADRVIRERKPVSLRDMPDGQSAAWLEGVVEKCLAIAPNNRFSTANALSESLAGEAASRTTGVGRAGFGKLSMPRYLLSAIAGLVLATGILSGIYLMPAHSWIALSMVRHAGLPPRMPQKDTASESMQRSDSAEDSSHVAARSHESVVISRTPTSFRFSLADVHQKGADTFLVQNIGMTKWVDHVSGGRVPVSYWAPQKNGTEGNLIYRFDLGGPAKSIHLRAIVHNLPYGGAAGIDASRDGKEWIGIANTLEPKKWGESINVNENLPEAVLGTASLWVRVRCLAEGPSLEDAFRAAQFARSRVGQAEPAFEVSAVLETGGNR